MCVFIYTLSSIVFALQWNEWKALTETIQDNWKSFLFGSVQETFVYHQFSQWDCASFLIAVVPLGDAACLPVSFWFALGLPLEFWDRVWVYSTPSLPSVGTRSIYHHAGKALTFKGFASLFQSKPLCVITDENVGIFNSLHIHKFRLQSKLCLIWFLLFGLLKRWKAASCSSHSLETPFETLLIVSEQTWASLLMGCKPGFTSQLLAWTSPLGDWCQTQESAFLQGSTQITFVLETQHWTVNVSPVPYSSHIRFAPSSLPRSTR